MLMGASRLAGKLTAGALNLGGKAALGVGGAALKHPGIALGGGLTAGLTGMEVAKGIRGANAALDPAYAQFAQNRGVAALPKV